MFFGKQRQGGGGTSDKTHGGPRRVRLPRRVYSVDAPDDDTVLVGINPEVRRLGDGQLEVFWLDPFYPLPDRSRRAASVTRVGEGIEFVEVGEESRIYRLQPITLDFYNERVRGRLINPQDFDTIEDLETALLRSLQS